MLICVFDGDPVGFVVAVLFGAYAIFSAGRLLVPREKLIDLPPRYFFWIAPEPEAPPRGSRIEPTRKPTFPTPRPTSSLSTVQDWE